VSGTAFAVVLAALAGLAGSVQVSVMGRFGERIGVLPALAFTLGVSTLLATGAMLVAHRSFDGFVDAVRSPQWLWLGALMGVFIVGTITVAGSRIGTTATIAILIAGQLAMGVVIDRWGLFGVDRIELSWPRALGILLLAVGAALSLHKA
jgi:bacterial/archaeal transporter family-2 protein